MGCTGYLVGLHRLSGGLHRLSGWVAQAIWCKTDNSAISDQTELGFGWVCLSLAISILHIIGGAPVMYNHGG